MGTDQTLAGLTTGIGAGWVRIAVSWAVFQPDNPSTWDNSAVTGLHQAIMQAQTAGMSVMITLQDTPPWARECWPENASDPWGYTVNYDTSSPRCAVDWKGPPHPAMWASYRQWVANMVSMYPEVNYWGIWNEPNDTQGSPTSQSPVDPSLGHFHPWPNTSAQDQYALLVGYASDAIHAVTGKKLLAPEIGGENCTCNGLIDSRAFLGNVLRSAGSVIDVVTVHDYGGPGTSRTDPSTMFNTLSQYADTLRGRWPMWLTEFGYRVPPYSEVQRVVQTNQVISNMRSNSIGEWKKSFVYNVAAADPFSLVPGYLSGNR